MPDASVVTTGQDLQPEPDHDKKMVEKFVNQGEAQRPTRPEYVPEKFWDAEKGVIKADELAKSYGELEKKLGTKQPPEKPAKAPEDKAPAPDDKTEQVKQELEQKGLDFSKYEAEYLEKGGLSEESYAELEQKGISRETTDNYIEGRKAVAERLIADIYQESGGEQGYNAMLDWAAANLSKAEIAAFNKALDAEPEQALLAVKGLHAKYVEVNGREPHLVKQGAEPVGGDVFESWPQVTDAMNDPRYARDPAYRRAVEQKIMRSKNL